MSFKKLFVKQSEVQESVEIVEKLQEMENEWPEIETKVLQLKEEVYEKLEEFKKLKFLGKFKEATDLTVELNKTQQEINNLEFTYKRKRDELRCRLEVLTRRIVELYCNQIDRTIKDVQELLNVSSVEKMPLNLFEEFPKKKFKCKTNLYSVGRVVRLLLNGKSKLRSMTSNSLPEIETTFQSILKSVSAPEMEQIEVTPPGLKELRSTIDEIKYGPPVSTPTIDPQQLNTLSDRIGKLADKTELESAIYNIDKFYEKKTGKSISK